MLKKSQKSSKDKVPWINELFYFLMSVGLKYLVGKIKIKSFRWGNLVIEGP